METTVPNNSLFGTILRGKVWFVQSVVGIVQSVVWFAQTVVRIGLLFPVFVFLQGTRRKKCIVTNEFEFFLKRELYADFSYNNVFFDELMTNRKLDLENKMLFDAIKMHNELDG